MKVFLGGTNNGSTWRTTLAGLLSAEYITPQISSSTFTEQDRYIETTQRTAADITLYVITPLMGGYFQLAEAVDDSNKQPKKTIFVVLKEDTSSTGAKVVFNDTAVLTLTAVSNMIKANGGTILTSLQEVADYINSLKA